MLGLCAAVNSRTDMIRLNEPLVAACTVCVVIWHRAALHGTARLMGVLANADWCGLVLVLVVYA